MPPSASKSKQKRSRKRKARTEVSSSSDTDSSDGERIAKAAEAKKIKTPPPSSEEITEIKHTVSPPPAATATVPSPSLPTQTSTPPPPILAPADSAKTEELFSALFLRKLTSELGDDLDKVREAKDFTERSLEMLVLALKQGERLFSAEEKGRFFCAGEGKEEGVGL